MPSPEILPVLRACADEIAESIKGHQGRGYSGQRPTQYHLDIEADRAGLSVLHGAGMRVVSEESGVTGSGEITVVMDPIDGSTNCDRGVPFYATSLAALRRGELVAGVVVNLATGDRFESEIGAGATRNGERISVSDARSIAGSIVAFSGLPSHHVGWAQLRILGAASLECCLVAEGSLDMFAVAQSSTLHSWDYLAGLLIVREAGGAAGDYQGAPLEIDTTDARRPVFASSQDLLDEALAVGKL